MSTPEQIKQQLLDQARTFANQGGLSGGGAYAKVGKYKLTFLSGKVQTGHKGYSEIFEFRVDQALKVGPDEPNGVGSTISCVFKPNEPGDLGNMSKKNRLAMAKAFANVSDADFCTEAGYKRVVDMYFTLLYHSDQCRGMAVDAEGYAGTNKKGVAQVYVKFTHDPAAHNAAEIAKRRQALDAGQG